MRYCQLFNEIIILFDDCICNKIISLSTLYFIWDRVTLWASIWCSTYEVFSGVSLMDMQGDCHTLLHDFVT